MISNQKILTLNPLNFDKKLDQNPFFKLVSSAPVQSPAAASMDDFSGVFGGSSEIFFFF